MSRTPATRLTCAPWLRKSVTRRSETVARRIAAQVSVRTSVVAAMVNAMTALVNPPLVAAWLARLASRGPVQPKPARMNPKP